MSEHCAMAGDTHCLQLVYEKTLQVSDWSVRDWIHAMH